MHWHIESWWMERVETVKTHDWTLQLFHFQLICLNKNRFHVVAVVAIAAFLFIPWLWIEKKKNQIKRKTKENVNKTHIALLDEYENSVPFIPKKKIIQKHSFSRLSKVIKMSLRYGELQLRIICQLFQVIFYLVWCTISLWIIAPSSSSSNNNIS